MMNRIYIILFLTVSYNYLNAQVSNNSPWFMVNPNRQIKTRFDKTCKFPIELKLENRTVSFPEDFDGLHSVNYTDGTNITIRGSECRSNLVVSEINENQGVRTKYLFEPTVTFLDTVYLENSNPPYDLQMMVIEQYTFR